MSLMPLPRIDSSTLKVAIVFCSRSLRGCSGRSARRRSRRDETRSRRRPSPPSAHRVSSRSASTRRKCRILRGACREIALTGREVVDPDDRAAVRQQAVGQAAADESRAAGDECPHAVSSWVVRWSVVSIIALHHHHEVITQVSQYRPSGRPAIQPPQPLVQAAVFSFTAVRYGGGASTHSPRKYSRRSGARTRGRTRAACSNASTRPACSCPPAPLPAQNAPDPRPVTLQRVVTDFPWTDPADHRKDQCRSRLQKSRALRRHFREVRHTVERTKVGIGARIHPWPLTRKVRGIRPPSACTRVVIARARRVQAGCAPPSPIQPVRRRNAMSGSSHANRIQPRAAAEIHQSAAWSERRIQNSPHLAAHVLDQRIIAPWSIVVRSNAIEGITRFAELLLPVVCRFGFRMK